MTDYADLSDRANFRGTADLKEFAVKHGFAVYGGAEEGVHAGDVNLAASYGENNTKYNTGRRWRGYNLFAPSKKIAMLGYGDSDKTYPMFVTPDRKISAEAVMLFQRDRYQGTSRLCQKSRKKVIKKAWNYRIHADIFCANYVVY